MDMSTESNLALLDKYSSFFKENSEFSNLVLELLFGL